MWEEKKKMWAVIKTERGGHRDRKTEMEIKITGWQELQLE